MQRTTTQMTAGPLPPEPPPALRAVRQSVESDLSKVESLKTPLTSLMFGEVDLKQCVEKRICKTLINADDEVVAFLVVKDHPNIASITYCNWVGWIRRFYRIDFASPWNTRFVHYLVWDTRYPNFFSSFLKTLYKNNSKLQQVLMVTPPKMQMFTELESLFTLVYPSYEEAAGSILNHLQNIHLNLRLRVVSKLTVRRAGEEDNIDVQPLVYHQLEVLRYVYGDVKLGNVIDLKTPSKAVLVAEKNSSTVGVLSASSRVDFNSINLFFHHVLEANHRDSVVDRVIRVDIVRSDIKRGLPFTPETMSTEEQLSIELNGENKQESTLSESIDEDEDREVVYWDEDGDMFRVVDPVMEYLLHSKKRGRHGPDTESVTSSTQRESDTSQQTLDYTYWGRPSWSTSVQPTIRDESVTTKVGTVEAAKEPQTDTFTPVENAFIITLFAIHPDLDFRYAFDILEASFECFPDKQFCLMSLPTAYQGSPLTRHMVRMPPKMSWDFPHELYFTHRNAVFSEFTVRSVSCSDLVDHGGVHELVENLSQGKKIIKDITKIILRESPGARGFVLECEGNIIGVAVITVNFGLIQLQPHFKIDELINMKLYDKDSHGLIRHLVLCPIFLNSGAFFLRQIMNQTGLETLSYCLLHDDGMMLHYDMSPITVLGDLIPVMLRRRIRYNLDALDDFKPQDHVVHLDHDFALFIATEKFLSIPKLELNYRIVVVGGSDTAMSFLENLIFRSARKHISYNNLVLVSIHGFPMELKSHLAGDKMNPHGGVYTREHLTRASLSTHVNVLYGALTVINRKEKMICLNEDHWLRYDYLILTTGMQFCKPWPALDAPTTKHGSTNQTMSCTTESDSSLNDDRDFPKQDCRKNEDIRELYSRAHEQYAENLFVINTTADAVIALGRLKKYFKLKKEGKVLIYGQGLNMYTCVESLLVFGVPGHKIVLVVTPRNSPGHGCLEKNPLVEKTVVQSMEDNGVAIHKGFSLICWSLKHKYLDRVMFRNDHNIPMTLDCVALFCYENKCTSAKTYMAVNDAGIVFNNGIVIDSQFRTNDEYIYAAGPGTRYSNRYYPTQYVHHKYYNSVEIGMVLSKIFRRLLEPEAEDYKAQQESEHDLEDKPQSPQSVIEDKAQSVIVDMALSFIADRALPVIGDKARSVMGDKVRSVMGGKTRSVTGGKTQSVTGDKTRSVLGDKTQSVLGDKSKSVLGDKSQSVLGDKSKSVLGEKSQSVLGDKSKSVLGDKTQSVLGDYLSMDLLPELREPVTWVAHLPGGWTYVKVSAPGRPLPLECQFNGQGDCGPILITGVPILPGGPGYFQLSFSVYNLVSEIVMLSKKEIPYQNLHQLYGKHERLLNNLYEQYNQGMIIDFFDFFSQPWAYALYTSQYHELARQCAEIFVNSESVGLPHFDNLESGQFSSALRRLRSGDQEAISNRYLSSSVPMYVEHLALKLISERPLQLPMYFTDAVLSSWHQSANSTSPLHRDTIKLRQKTKISSPHSSLPTSPRLPRSVTDCLQHSTSNTTQQNGSRHTAGQY